MRNKLLALMLVFLIIFTSACSNDVAKQSEEVVTPVSKDGTAEITIIMSTLEYDRFTADTALMSYVGKFEREMGVKVNIEKDGPPSPGWASTEYQTEYIKKASTKLYAKDGPELIYSDWIFMNAAIDQGAVLNVKGKVQNINKIYDGLVGEQIYYVPIGVMYKGNGIKKQILEDLKQEEPDYEFTSDEYNKLIDQWISNTKLYFAADEYQRLYNELIFPYTKRESKNDKVKINRPEIIAGIKKLRQEIFSGKYKLVKGFTYQSYYNAFYEGNSEEFEAVQQLEMENKADFKEVYINNILRAEEISEVGKKYEAVMLPNFANRTPYIDTKGFMVNKNGKNLELAYEFINGLLSDEVQMEIFIGGIYNFYPVNKNIEAKILKIEEQEVKDQKAIELKKYALSKLKEGQQKIEPDRDYKLLNMHLKTQEDLDKLILTDISYTDEQLQLELQKLEDKYNIWLNE